jgi:ribose 5-phosphate isomerase A
MVAVSEVASGMLVGLGTGRAANRAIRALASRVAREALDIDCVCTSAATESLARELSLPIVPFADVERVDLLLDGAHEVDHDLRMLKGQSGATTRQRLVAEVADRRVYLSSEDKLVQRLGTAALLAITIIPFGVASIRARLRDLGYMGVLRHTLEGEIFVSDGGGVILDSRLPDRNADEIAQELDHVTGVVDHGLFLTEADTVLLERKDGSVRRMDRPQE